MHTLIGLGILVGMMIVIVILMLFKMDEVERDLKKLKKKPTTWKDNGFTYRRNGDGDG